MVIEEGLDLRGVQGCEVAFGSSDSGSVRRKECEAMEARVERIEHSDVGRGICRAVEERSCHVLEKGVDASQGDVVSDDGRGQILRDLKNMVDDPYSKVTKRSSVDYRGVVPAGKRATVSLYFERNVCGATSDSTHGPCCPSDLPTP